MSYNRDSTTHLPWNWKEMPLILSENVWEIKAFQRIKDPTVQQEMKQMWKKVN
jgi:hypothetical protein